MTAKEKAKELVDKFIQYSDALPDDIDWLNPVEYSEEKEFSSAKQCAIIAVDEIIASHYKVLIGVHDTMLDYWVDVKREIEKL